MLVGLFEDETILVNIKNEFPGSYTISERVSLWLASSPRHFYIGRGSDWGNPYSHQEGTAAEFLVASREEAIEKYREYVQSRPDLLARLGELKSKILGCWCVPELCHGNILLWLLSKYGG